MNATLTIYRTTDKYPTNKITVLFQVVDYYTIIITPDLYDMLELNLS